MKIWNNTKFVVRLLISLFCACLVLSLFVVPSILAHHAQGNEAVGVWFGALVALILIYGIIWVVGALILLGINWVIESEFYSRWMKWLTASEDAEEFLEKI